MSADCPCCGEPRPAVRWGELSVSLEDGAHWCGRPLTLSPQRLSLLHHLTRRAPRTVNRDALLLSSFGEEAGDNVLSVQVHRLRQALEEAGVPIGVACAWGRGYRLERA